MPAGPEICHRTCRAPLPLSGLAEHVTMGVQVTRFRGQGSEADYQVSGLFERDFAFNQLADREPMLQMISKRRMARKLSL